MRRVCFVMQSLLPMPPVGGGAVETLVQQLLEQNEKDARFEFTVCCRADDRARPLYAQYRHTKFIPILVRDAEMRRMDLLRRGIRKLHFGYLEPEFPYLRRVCRALQQQTFDAVVVENQPAFVHRLSQLQIGPVYLHMHNVIQPTELRDLATLESECSKLIGVSSYICKHMAETVGLPTGKAVPLLNCIDVDRFKNPAWRAGRARLRETLGIAPNALVLVFVGRVCPEKGAFELARAFSRLQVPQAALLFVGSRWFDANTQDDYQRMIAQEIESVKNRVYFTGYVPYDEIPGYYAAADIAVLPSMWEEPSMLTALEAQAAGLPVISTRSGGIPENTCPESALLLERRQIEEDLIEAITRLAEHPDERLRMSCAARAFVNDRGCERFYHDFERIVLNESRQSEQVV